MSASLVDLLVHLAKRKIRDRSAVFETVLAAAAELGMEAAIARFGSSLSETEKTILSALSVDDIEKISITRTKLSELAWLS